MNQANIIHKIQPIKALFKNIRDTLIRDEIIDVRTKIYKNTKLYEYYVHKIKLNKKQTNKQTDLIKLLII